MIQFQNREIQGERLVLNSKTDLYYLGHDLTLRNCTVIIRVPARGLVISKVRFIDCVIEVKQELKNFRWNRASLKGCRFTGKMTGNDFGRWPFDEEAVQALGGIEDCDFSGARLNACRFLNCDVDTLKLPSWPCFTFLDPTRRRQELLAAPWPGTSRIVAEVLVDSPPETVAATDSAPAVAKRFGTTEEALRDVLQTLDGVRF
ncbi:hypothetical protein [Myxococcus qinghaiensis]|uniref:hypothetical protein n=1 Tax=Myxococcus qinghaiensis TaxID=2906758 RepID=UPI0020A7AB40|nr:hypothetical protein [Myxococcus qinghaiensis]MCP3166056.1 hypothetical protein [Myxococcus qinghaiensis]